MKVVKHCVLLFLLAVQSLAAQSPDYQKKMPEKIKEGSPFTKIINRELPATILFKNKELIAFVPLSQQVKFHILIVPKKEIPTINDAEQKDAALLG